MANVRSPIHRSSSSNFAAFKLSISCPCLLGKIKKPRLTETELEQIEAAYSIEDRSWKKVIQGRTICAMGKFKLTGNKEIVRAAAKTMKEKDQSSSLKRKSDLSESLPNTSVICMRSKTPQDEAVSSSKLSVLSSTVVDFPDSKGKETVGMADATRSSSSPVRLSLFFEEIKRRFFKSSFIRPIEGSPDFEHKLHMTLDKTTAVLYAQYEMPAWFLSFVTIKIRF